MQFYIDSILFSYAQIFFSNRRWFGLLIFLGTLVIPQVGLLALAGVILSNLTAKVLKFDKEKIRTGFYGFNGLLFAAASGFYFELSWFLVLLILVFIVITFFISAVLEHHLAQVFNLPSLSLPFVISLYIFLIFLTNFDTIFYKNLEFVDYAFLSFIPEIIKIYFKAFSLIIFQSSIITGIVFVFSLILFSRVMFVNSIIAFTINYFMLSFIFPDFNDTLLILTSFNSILTSFALGGSLIILSRKTFPLILVSTIAVIIFTGFFSKVLINYFLPVLVLPFNFVVLSVIYSLKFREEHSDLVLLYFSPGAPEENYYYHRNRRSRFSKFSKLFAELPFFGEWFIPQGIEGNVTHKDKWKYAWDFVIHNDNEDEYNSNGDSKEDYLCYGTPVAASAGGKVVKVFDNVSDNEIGDANLKNNWGNTVIVEHEEGVYTSLSHLKPGSIRVKEGDIVKKGEIVAKCGNSGRSPYPHLHFQFQLTDKLGDRTHKFPIAHFLEKSNGKYNLKSFDYPAENTYVKNIETHKSLKRAFKFRLGDEFKVECKLNEEIWEENWEVKVDIMNDMFIESDNGARAYLYPKEKVFYVANFLGNKKSALYYFYLSTITVPLGYEKDLVWRESYPLYIALNKSIRYFSELFLLFAQMIKAESTLRFLERQDNSEDFKIESELNIKGTGIFSFFSEKGKGTISISKEGLFSTLVFIKKDINFSAKFRINSETE